MFCQFLHIMWWLSISLSMFEFIKGRKRLTEVSKIDSKALLHKTGTKRPKGSKSS